jgi:hypothetical protein
MDPPNVNVCYHNTIGVLHIKLPNISQENFKNLLHKCEDGLLTIKILQHDSYLQFSIFISKSMCVNFKDSKVTLGDNLNIRYNVTKNLNVTDIFNQIDTCNILSCLSILEEITRIKCLNCNCLLYKLIGMKFVTEFNYNYIDNLEILSCHEHDINNIIPNLDEKLTRL